MTLGMRRHALVLSVAAVSALGLLQGNGPAAQGAGAQTTRPDRTGSGRGGPEEDVHLPNGKLQSDEILKAEREQNVKDAAQLVELAQQLQIDLEKNDRFVLSIATLKKTEDIEKLAKKIRSRMHH